MDSVCLNAVYGIVLTARQKIYKKQEKTFNLKGKLVYWKIEVKTLWSTEDPVVWPLQEYDSGIREYAKFWSKRKLIIFIILVYNGDVNKIPASATGIMTCYNKYNFTLNLCGGNTNNMERCMSE